jgi:glycosyltransferase involved in cell wall biosynthesis
MSTAGHDEQDAHGISMKTISVVVCTYNRCDLLAKTLETLAASKLPLSIKWDVVVVDNNSTDETRKVVESFCNLYPRFRYAFEPRQGLSYARNTGIAQSRGEIVAFVDDDERVELDWLWNLTSPLCDGKWAGAGGRIMAAWPRSLPDWLADDDPNNIGPFGTLDLGEEAGDLGRPPYGGNMAYTREMFERYGNFRTDLGRSSNNLQGREEIEFANRLLGAGEHLWYAPQAVVHHKVLEHRMERPSVLQWWYWYGRSEITDLGLPATRWSILGIPIAFFRRLLRWSLQALFSMSPARRFYCQRNVWYIAGSAVACFQLRHSKNHDVSTARSVSETEERELSGPAGVRK